MRKEVAACEPLQDSMGGITSIETLQGKDIGSAMYYVMSWPQRVSIYVILNMPAERA